MAKQNNSQETQPETINGQMDLIIDRAAEVTERVWQILDEHEVDYSTDFNSEKETLMEAMMKMFDSIHTKLFSLFVDALYSTLAIQPNPKIESDSEKTYKEWEKRREVTPNRLRIFEDSRLRIFEQIIKQKTGDQKVKLTL